MGDDKKKKKEEEVEVEDLDTEGEDVKGGVGVSQAAIRKGSASTLGSQTIQKERSIRIQPRDPRRR